MEYLQHLQNIDPHFRKDHAEAVHAVIVDLLKGNGQGVPENVIGEEIENKVQEYEGNYADVLYAMVLAKEINWDMPKHFEGDELEVPLLYRLNNP